MRTVVRNCLVLALMCACTTALGVQANVSEKSTAEPNRPMVLTEAIPLETAKGRLDHFAFGEGRLFVSELGSNAVAVINVGARVVERILTGVPYSQGVAFSPDANKLFAASGAGKLYIYDGKSYDLITTIDFEGGADNLRYDASSKHIYVGCGDNETTGAIVAVDPMTNRRLEEVYKLGGEPESFQLEKSGPNIYVNVPDLKQIVVINRVTKMITRWQLDGVSSNFPMALDEMDHRLFVGTRTPARLTVFDTASGHMIVALPSVVDTDDLYYDADRKRIYMPGGEGFIDIFQMKDPNHYALLAKVPTALGARTAGYFGKQGKGFDRLYLGVPARGGQHAEIRIYTVQD